MDHMDQHVSRVLEVDVEEIAANHSLATPYLTALSGSLNIQGRTRTKQKRKKKQKKNTNTKLHRVFSLKHLSFSASDQSRALQGVLFRSMLRLQSDGNTMCNILIKRQSFPPQVLHSSAPFIWRKQMNRQLVWYWDRK